MTRSMTKGSPIKLILLFMIPLLVGNLFQQFYSAADTFIVGNTIGVDALAAVGCTGAVTFLILGFAAGVTSGMSILTAQHFGADDLKGVRKSFAASLILCLIITAVLTAVSVPFTKQFLILLRTPPEILDDAYSYLVVLFAGIVASMLFNLLSGVMRAVGDSLTPLIFLVIACVVNVVLDYVFILNLGMGVGGTAVATVISQLFSSVLCVLYINKKVPILRLRLKDFKVSRAELLAHARVALPMGFQMSIIAIGSIMIQFALNGLGKTSIAAYTAAQKIDSFAVLPMMSFGIAMATFAAQNYGAEKYGRIRKGLLQCSAISVSFSFAMGLINLFFGDRLASIFVSANPEAVGLAHTYLSICGMNYFILALLFIFRNTLQGIGKMLVPTVAGVMELIMRVFAAVILSHYFGYVGVCIANPLAWLGATLPMAAALFIYLRKLLPPKITAAKEACL